MTNATAEIAPGRKTEAKTLAAQVYEKLREDIVAGHLEPGSKLKLEQLLSKYSVGMSPLREALSRLVGDMLVTSQGQRGFRVAPLSLTELEDIARTRSFLETEALSLSVQKGDEEWLETVEQSYRALAQNEEELDASNGEPPSDLVSRWEESNRQFHAALLSACGSVWLLRLNSILNQQMERYRRLSLRHSRGHRDIAGEHYAIYKAVKDRKILKACELIEQHLDLTTEEVRRALLQNEEEAAEA
ncbi:MAG: transcriptional regulator [Ponticaulis sp.]|nr:transcriptional regulator [Ponticaulis sp.]